jgi:hypothetical protein
LRDLPVAADLLNGKLILVSAQIDPQLLLESTQIRADLHTAQRRGGQLAELVLEVGVHDAPLGLLDQLDQAANATTHVFQHR